MNETYSLADVRKMAEAPGGEESFSLAQVRAMAQEQPAPATGISALALVNPAAQAAALFTPQGRTQLGRLALGGVRGVSEDIGNTLLNAGGAVFDKVTGSNAGGRWNADRSASLKDFFSDRIPEGDVAANMGRISTNIAGTMGVGPALAIPLRAGAAVVPAAASVLNPVASAISSSGMSTGLNVARNAPLAARAGDMALRVAGGAATGYAGAGLVDPSMANMGAIFGGATPPVLQGARAVTRGLGNAASALRPAPGVSGADVRTAREIAEMAGINPQNLDEVVRLRDVLRQQGPQIIPGQSTVPEMLQMPGVSQLQRSVKNVQPAPFVARDAEREAARRGVLDAFARGRSATGPQRTEAIPQPVPFDQIQKLRSSVNEAINAAERNGQNQARAALINIKNAIDNKVAEVASGVRQPGEVFTPQAVDTWGQALAAHANKKQQFNTGPQAALFRRGGDGLSWGYRPCSAGPGWLARAIQLRAVGRSGGNCGGRLEGWAAHHQGVTHDGG